MYSNWNAESRKLSGNSPGFMINDDRFILGSLENWEFGVDNTGDLMEPANLERLVERSRQLGDIHLVTADGSIDCQVSSLLISTVSSRKSVL